MPCRPAASSAAKARYGLTSAPGMRHSTRSAGPCAQHAEAGGAVVAAPDRLGRRERAGLEALVGVDVGREEQGEVAGRARAARRGTGGRASLSPCSSANTGAPLVASHERAVDVAAAAGEAEVPLGHEGHGLALEVGDLLDAVLVDRVPVGHLERLGVVQVELGLARAPLALARTRPGCRPRPCRCGSRASGPLPWWSGGCGSPRCTSRRSSGRGSASRARCVVAARRRRRTRARTPC